MKLTRLDVAPLLIIGVSGMVGALFLARRTHGPSPQVTVEPTLRVTSSPDVEWIAEELHEASGAMLRSEGNSITFETTEALERGAQIRIRRVPRGGLVTGADPAPLIYVDGVRTQQEFFDEIEPNQIERIEIVKGEAAIAMYGDDATGGVILIFLKPDAAGGSGR